MGDERDRGTREARTKTSAGTERPAVHSARSPRAFASAFDPKPAKGYRVPTERPEIFASGSFLRPRSGAGSFSSRSSSSELYRRRLHFVERAQVCGEGSRLSATARALGNEALRQPQNYLRATCRNTAVGVFRIKIICQMALWVQILDWS
jgi:hypothetical protein